MKKIVLKAENIIKSFYQGNEETNVLSGINVDIYEGDFTVIMGPSGAGKSTLLYVLSGMDELTSGNVYYHSTNIHGSSDKQKAKLRAEEFGFVFQQNLLVSNLTLFENVAVAGLVSGKGKRDEIMVRAGELLESMNVKHATKRLPSQVSGGEGQRAAIARAMIGKPGILFADEPTGALNKSNSIEVLNLFTSINKQGQSILMVTHDIKCAIRANRILYIEDGNILDQLLLPVYSYEEEKQRKETINKWLSDLQW